MKDRKHPIYSKNGLNASKQKITYSLNLLENWISRLPCRIFSLSSLCKKASLFWTNLFTKSALLFVLRLIRYFFCIF